MPITKGFYKELQKAGAMAQYDAQCKRILSHKIILVRILKHVIKEFAGMRAEEIVECIESQPEISESTVMSDEMERKISGLSNEDKIPGEGSIRYDIRFYTHIPAKEGRIRMIMNLEAQKSFYPGYEIVTRGIFYGARMISSQMGVEFMDSHYDDVRKVYSIWICMNAPLYIGNAVSEYSMGKRDISGHLPDRPKAYDKLTVVLVALNQRAKQGGCLTQMLNVIFSEEMMFQEKKKILQTQYHIFMDNELQEEVNTMCNLSEYVLERGIEQGTQIEKRETVARMMQEGLPFDMILRLTRITPEQFEEYRRALPSVTA